MYYIDLSVETSIYKPPPPSCIKETPPVLMHQINLSIS
nr:MAG TPA: NADH dehydrogenase [Crassvirales sp.]